MSDDAAAFQEGKGAMYGMQDMIMSQQAEEQKDCRQCQEKGGQCDFHRDGTMMFGAVIGMQRGMIAAVEQEEGLGGKPQQPQAAGGFFSGAGGGAAAAALGMGGMGGMGGSQGGSSSYSMGGNHYSSGPGGTSVKAGGFHAESNVKVTYEMDPNLKAGLAAAAVVTAVAGAASAAIMAQRRKVKTDAGVVDSPTCALCSASFGVLAWRHACLHCRELHQQGSAVQCSAAPSPSGTRSLPPFHPYPLAGRTICAACKTEQRFPCAGHKPKKACKACAARLAM